MINPYSEGQWGLIGVSRVAGLLATLRRNMAFLKSCATVLDFEERSWQSGA